MDIRDLKAKAQASPFTMEHAPGISYKLLHVPTEVVVIVPESAYVQRAFSNLLAGQRQTKTRIISMLVVETLQRYARGELPRIWES